MPPTRFRWKSHERRGRRERLRRGARFRRAHLAARDLFEGAFQEVVSALRPLNLAARRLRQSTGYQQYDLVDVQVVPFANRLTNRATHPLGAEMAGIIGIGAE